MFESLQNLSFVSSPSIFPEVSDDVRASFDEAAQYFTTPLQMFQFYDKYARFDYKLGRRETWVETVDRSVNFLRELSENKLPESEYARIRHFILTMKSMPSMRLLAMAGDAARRSNIALFNCSYCSVDSIDAFVEALIVSMNGCGVGFSVENQYVSQLPIVQFQTGEKLPTFIVPDDSEGWADTLRLGLETWFGGKDIEFDYSQVRPHGAVLKIKGGRASGPEPLKLMLDFAREIILAKQGGKLSSVDCLDLMCVVGNGNDPNSPSLFADCTIKPYWVKDPERKSNPSLRKGTLIYTTNGIYPIESLENTTFSVRNIFGRESSAVCRQSGTNRPLYKIVLDGGFTYYATGEHMWPVVSRNGSVEKRQTIDLLAGMELPVIKPKSLNFGSAGTYEEGFFAGWLLGDGWITPRPSLNCTQIGMIVSQEKYEQGIAKRLLETLNSKKKPVSNFHKRVSKTGSVTYELNCRASEIKDFLDRIGLSSKANGLPSSIWNIASEEFRKGVIDGLYSSDGSVYVNPNFKGCGEVTLSTASEKMAHDVVELLGFYGINAKIHNRKVGNVKFPNGKTYDREYSCFDVRIRAKDDISHFAETFDL